MKYGVVFRTHTERHFVKTFAKKYKKAWDKTHEALSIEFANIDLLLETTIAEVIRRSEDENIRICKTEFKIAGTTVSRHASGYRCIVAVNTNALVVEVLLVYAKGDLRGKTETVAWMQEVKNNYPEYRYLFS